MALDSKNYLEATDFRKPDGFSKYTAGPKTYGLSGSSAAQSGPMGPQGQAGYMERDAQANARRQAILKRMQAQQRGRYMSPEGLGGLR